LETGIFIQNTPVFTFSGKREHLPTCAISGVCKYWKIFLSADVIWGKRRKEEEIKRKRGKCEIKSRKINVKEEIKVKR
jgi:phage gp37-like protein